MYDNLSTKEENASKNKGGKQVIPKNKRVRTKFLGGAVNGEMTDAFAIGVLEEWVVQDDIVIIGAEVIVELDMRDAILNADYEGQCIVELSRAGLIERDGCIVSVQAEVAWTAAIQTGGNGRVMQVVMFPEGYGIPVDAGERVNLLSYFSKVAAATATAYGSAIVYYVEQ